MSGRVGGKVAVVTGGASGLGRACALRLAEEGAAGVLVADLHDRAEAVAEEIAAMGVDSAAIGVDVSRESDCDAMAEYAAERWGRIDIAVAAAGISFDAITPERDKRAVTDMDLASWQRVLDVNVNGVMLTDRAVAKRMIANGTKGSIVNMGSICSRWTREGNAPYTVSKAAVLMLTKCVALELAPHGIRVNAVGPGYIETPMTESFRDDPAAFERVITSTPLGRFGQPVEIANTVLFLASDEASYFTGEILFPDGGFLASTR
jgi:3-oxoacyl-[acyl-carrier protein] reductase